MCACGSIIRNCTLDSIIGSSDEYNFSEIILLLINKCVYGQNPVNVLLLCGIGESYILALSYRIVPVPRMYALFVLYLVSPIGYTWTCNFNGFFYLVWALCKLWHSLCFTASCHHLHTHHVRIQFLPGIKVLLIQSYVCRSLYTFPLFLSVKQSSN